MKNSCGIYKLTIGDQFYIGSSGAIGIRMSSHISLLKGGNHSNKLLQKKFNECGYDNCFLELIESCSFENLRDRERFYIETLKPQLNTNGRSNKSYLLDKRVVYTFRINPTLIRKLNKQADIEKRGVGIMLEIMIEKYLSKLPIKK
jgi:group I intron endonuclease